MSRELQLVRGAFPDDAALGTAVSHAILQRVASGELPETFRLGRPGRVIAFGRQDVASPGYTRAVAAARSAGFQPVERLAGGRAAPYTEGTMSFSWARADDKPARNTRLRFAETAELIRDALVSLGVDARIGEVPGEYCPGAFSVNAGGTRKLAGIGQRLIKGAAHVGGVLAVNGSADLREALTPIYSALEIDWDPAATGSVDEAVPGLTVADAESAIVAALNESFEITEVGFDEETLELACRLTADHTSPVG